MTDHKREMTAKRKYTIFKIVGFYERHTGQIRDDDERIK